MKITISNYILVENPTDELKKYAKKELVFTNPQYAKMRKMGKGFYRIPKEIQLFDIYEGNLYLPIGVFDDIYRMYPDTSLYKDYTVTKQANIKSNIVLRDYQVPTIRAVREHCTGIIGLKVGTGKTESILHTIGELNQKTLFMAHTIELVRQAEQRCHSKMECKTGIISDGKMCDIENCDIVFGTIQSVYKFITDGTLQPDDFGMIVIDEVQHLSCNPNSIQMFKTVFSYFAARYKVGLSAEVHRADGLAGCILKIVGPVIYGMERSGDNYKCMYEGKELMRFPVTKFQVPCHVVVRETNYNIEDKEVYSSNGGTIEFASLISDLSNNVDRNRLIINDIKKMGGYTIVLSDRVAQLQYIQSQLGDIAIEIDGSTPKKIRKKLMEEMREGKYKVLCISTNIAKEGLDIPRLSNLVLATPFKDYGSVIQSCGRIQRLYEGKTIAYVYDYVDDVGMLYGFYSKRRAIYRKNGWIIDNMYLGNK